VRIGLGVNRDYLTKAPTDAIGIILSEPQGLTAVSWQLDIFASTEVGSFMVGTLFTSPGAVGATVGVAPNRLIGHAVCPGARAWKIRAIGPNPTGGVGQTVGANISADLKAIPVNAAAFGFGSGVFYAQGRVALNGGTATAPLTAARQDWIGPNLLQGVSAYNPGTNATELWIMSFDFFSLAGPPPNGSQPSFGLALDLPSGATGQLVLNPPVRYINGLWTMVSSTPDTLTASALTCRIITTATV
jgi:hypothetical protein